MRISGEDHLIEPVGLALDRFDDMRMVVAVRDHPPGRYRVEDAAAVRRLEPRALGGGDLDGRRLQRVLGEGVPDRRRVARCHVVASARKSARRKFPSNAARDVAVSSGSRRGSQPSRRTPPISTMVRSESACSPPDEGDAEQRNAASLQGFDRQQACDLWSPAGSRRTARRAAPAGEEINLQEVPRQRHHQPAGALDDERPRPARVRQGRQQLDVIASHPARPQHAARQAW